ncbi:HAMP domain-containing sensor histidine kinase [Halorubrum sp. 2020YC2]|uniref:sensor histidine kinase n=1 Tax=Halorubrum sp. 2020YC2 TaxID=2836432 RepID=UPI001BEBD992|nr:HAMP domain-containing sensor histidine kinase [Halorubrum sp. 2020YC2]QWC18699.1 HAMP domain-containing histidine kinase [Halorubrum sp. 2020YC2]
MAAPPKTVVKPLWPIWGLGLAFVLSLAGELALLSVGSVPEPSGYWVGYVSSAAVLLGVGYLVRRLPRSDISVARYRRLNRWWLAGAAVFLLVNVGFMPTLPTESAFQVFGWIRWAIGFGGGIGLLIGLFEARAIEREVRAERDRIRRTELRRERDRLEEFASVVSHDLRNPLTVARGHLDLARREHPDDDHLDAVEPALDRMEDIIGETLALAREGKRVDEVDDVAVDECARRCWSRVDTADATLRVAEPPAVRADADRLSHVFENLFRNAVEHGGPGVTVRVGALDGEVGFFFEDDGPGIPDDRAERVRETGFTTTQDGTGFGLAIVDQIVDAHGWTLRIGAGDDGGARFEIAGVDRPS